VPHWPGVFADFHRLWGHRAAGPRYSDGEKLAWAELLAVLQLQADRDGHFQTRQL
jgi:hypothetical protein